MTKTIKKTVKTDTVKIQFKYDRVVLAKSISTFIGTPLAGGDSEQIYDIDEIAKTIILKEDSYIKSAEKTQNKNTYYELAALLVARNMNIVSKLYENKDSELERIVNKNEELMNNLYKAAFKAYSVFDFVDLTDMLNYRGSEFNHVGATTSKDDSLEAQYIVHKPGSYEVKEIQEYTYWALQEALNRFRDMLTDDAEANDEALGEYYNHDSGIYCKVTKDAVEINYIPLTIYCDSDGLF